MNIKLTRHAEELITATRARRREPVERIVEHALEAVVCEEHVEVGKAKADANQREAVHEMLAFITQNRVHLGAGHEFVGSQFYLIPATWRSFSPCKILLGDLNSRITMPPTWSWHPPKASTRNN